MSQPSFLNRYIQEWLLYFARSSPYVCIAEALDLMLRVFVYRFSKLPLRDSFVMARERFDNKPEHKAEDHTGHKAEDNTGHEAEDNTGREAEDDTGRSILVTWLLFFLAALGPAGKMLAMRGVPGTKATACLYVIGIVIRAAVDAVPKRRKEKETPPASELGLPISQNSLAHRRERIVERTDTFLERCSIVLQILGIGATLAVILWISFTLLNPLERRLVPKPVHFGSIQHFWTFLKHLIEHLLEFLLALILSVLVYLMECVIIFACYLGVGCLATVLGLEHLKSKKPDMLRVMLYTSALVLLFTTLAFYAHLYNSSGTSKAGVPEALG
ncbi:hypothetical protein MMC20_006406 [Loxospora ochrophaea]|nr:hypothetical protein [Loxospora ochrophaea]